MLIPVVKVKALPNHHLQLLFEDGVEKVVDLMPFIRQEGISAPLQDEMYFAQVSVEAGGGITWPNGYDFCPVFLRQDVPAVELSVE